MTHSHVKSYVIVYFLLLLLVVVTVAVAHVPTGLLAFPIALTIALIKACLIVAIFMHLKEEAPLVRVFAGVGIFWLGILFTILMADYLTRKNTRPLKTDIAYVWAPHELEATLEHKGEGDEESTDSQSSSGH